MKKKNIGSSFDSWLGEEGIREEVTAAAIKRVLARQVEAAMKEKNFSKAEMARRMHTSRAALDRLLDPEYDAVTLSTLRKAATAVGRELRLELRYRSPPLTRLPIKIFYGVNPADCFDSAVMEEHNLN